MNEYTIIKIVKAKSVNDAIKNERKGEIKEIFIRKNSEEYPESNQIGFK